VAARDSNSLPIRGDADTPIRRNPLIVAAIITGAFALANAIPPAVGTVLGPVLTDDPPKPPDCIVILDKYDRYIGTDAGKVIILTIPGPDKKSPIDADSSAKQCGIDVDTLREMAKTK
jgi:hypothetical protein